MSKREITEINAGSMADIAFLLLIFFLITTTMDIDQGILAKLHQEDQAVPERIPEHKILKVLVNGNDELLIEDELGSMNSLAMEARQFLINGGVFQDELPDDRHVKREVWVNDDFLQSQRTYIMNGTESEKERKLAQLSEKRIALELFGPYKELDKSAVIALQVDMSTSYETYIQIQNQIHSATNALRDELCMDRIGKRFLELDSRIPEERKLIIAIQRVYPFRFMEAEMVNFGQD